MSTNSVTNFRLNSSMLVGGQFLSKLGTFIDNNSNVNSFTYVDNSVMYMNAGTRCQQPLPNELNISLSNMKNYDPSTTSTDSKVAYVMLEIASWKPNIVNVNGLSKHVVSHTDLHDTLHYYSTKKIETPITSTITYG